MNIAQYQTLIFDCDGVILNSNNVKTQAFYDVTQVYGRESAQALKDYHIKNGGISRYKKFEYFFTNILKRPARPQEIDKLLSDFSKKVREGLLTCGVTDGLEKLRRITCSRWIIVSGGDQTELREVFELRGLSSYFDGGIFGSPDEKEKIVEREKSDKNIIGKSLFLGDSMYDYQVSLTFELDFIFLTQWTDFYGWNEYFKKRGVQTCTNISQLITL